MLHRIAGAVLLVLVGVLIAYKFSLSRNIESPSTILIDASIEDIRKEIQTGEHKITLVNFWASWCVPCLKEFPELLQIKEKYADKGLKVIFISADDEKQRADALRFLQAHKVTFTTYVRAHDQKYEVFDALYPGWNGALPATLIFNTKGEVLDSWFGETSGAEFEARVQKQL